MKESGREPSPEADNGTCQQCREEANGAERSSLGPRGEEFAAVLAAARAGSNDALSELTEQFRQYLWLVADREIRPGLQGKVGASDLVQETFVVAQERFRQFRGATQPEWLGWLCRIMMTKLSRERRRYLGTQKRNVLREAPLNGDALDLEAVIASLSGTSPGTSLVRQEVSAILAREIEALPPDYRRVIDLRSWQRKAFAEIGQEMGRSADAVRKLWTRAVEQLSVALERLHEPP